MLFLHIQHLSVERFIADRISHPAQNKGNISRPIVNIGIIGIATGVCVMLITVSIVLGFKNEIISKITGLTTHLTISNVNLNASNEPEPIHISADTLRKILALPEVSHLQASAFKNGLLKTDTENEGILLKGVDKNFDFTFLKKHLVKGELPQLAGTSASPDILISESLSRRMNLQLGQRLQVYFISQRQFFDGTSGQMVEQSEHRSRRFTVCGIFKTDFSDFDQQLSIVDIRHIQKLNYWDSSMVGAYELRLKDFGTEATAVERVQDLLGYDYSVRSVKEIYSNIFIWLEKLDINGIIVVVMMILVATVNMITALLILILERANMVGLVKSFGMDNISVRRVFAYISLKLTLKGMFWGNVAGISLCLLQYYFKIAKLNSSTYYVDHVAIEINWWFFLFLNLGTLLVCFCMLLLPTMILTRLTPIRTLKFD